VSFEFLAFLAKTTEPAVTATAPAPVRIYGEFFVKNILLALKICVQFMNFVLSKDFQIVVKNDEKFNKIFLYIIKSSI
jgi:hypothetical protein